MMTVKDLLLMLRPHEKPTPEGQKVIDLTLQLERFSFGTLIANPPDGVHSAMKLTVAKMDVETLQVVLE